MNVFRNYPLLVTLAVCLLAHGSVYAQNASLSALYDQVMEAYDNEDYGAILDRSTEVLDAIAGVQDTTAASLLATLGEVEYFDGDPDAGLDLMAAAYDLYTQLGATDGPDFADLVFNLAYIHLEFGLYHEGEPYGEQMVAFDRAGYGVNSEEYASSLVTLSKLHQYQNSFDVAIELCEVALSEITPESYPYYIVQTQLADLYMQAGRFTESEEQLLAALALEQYLSGSNTLDYAATLTSLASLYRLWGKYAESERLFLDALDILDTQTPDPMRDDVLTIAQNNLGLIYNDMARYEEALALFNDLLETVDPEEPSFEAGIYLTNKANVQRHQENYAAASENLKAALGMFEALVGTEDLTYLQILKQQAMLLNAQGDYAAASEIIDQLLTKFEDILGRQNPSYLLTLLEQGQVLAHQSNYRQARRSLRQFQKQSADVFSTRHPLYAQASLQLAHLHWSEEKIAQAKAAFAETFDNYFGQIDAYFPALSEPEKAKFYNNTLKVAFEEFNSFAMTHAQDHPELLGQMYDYQLATKALIMYSTSKVRQSVMDSGNEALIAEFNQWLSLKEQISRMYSMSQEELDAQPVSLGELIEQTNRFEKTLGEHSRDFYHAYVQEQVTWQQVRDALQPGEAAVEIIRFRQFEPQSGGAFNGQVCYAALVVRHDTRDYPELVVIENGAELEENWVAYYRNSILYHLTDSYSYDHFWAPIKAALGDATKVYLSPDGLYHQVSFHTLLNPETGDYLLDEIQIEQVTNTKDILAYQALADEGPRMGKAFFFGFPNYNLGLDEQTLAAADLANKVANTVTLDRGLRGSLQRMVNDQQLLAMLPGTKTEVEQIASLYGSANLDFSMYMEDEAVEEHLKAVEQPSTLHIATHGFFLEDVPEAQSGDNDYVGNPLLRSGLILAGANTFIAAGTNESPLTEEDGILTAYEVMNMNLSHTDLVVLSACETGLGTIKNGEGVYGLQRAFRVAGANAIIMSLWTVNDAATQQLMSLFYQYWLESGDKQAAFDQAQKELREQFPDPYYWGAFVLVGR